MCTESEFMNALCISNVIADLKSLLLHIVNRSFSPGSGIYPAIINIHKRSQSAWESSVLVYIDITQVELVIQVVTDLRFKFANKVNVLGVLCKIR